MLMHICVAQFSKYDPVTIRSHAGVRADLFNRPLERTLITDFFGGVAHAEVLASSAVDIGLSMASSQNQSLDEYSSDERSVESVEVESWEDVSTIESGSASRTLRAWGSLFVVGGLVGWVRLNSQRRA